MPPRIVARQLSHPHGFLGRIIRMLMNRTNAQLNAFAIRQLQLEATMPFDDGSFDKALTVNTVYFWTSLDAGFSEIHRVLSPGGLLVVGFLPREAMDRLDFPADIFTSRAPEDLIVALGRHGFANARIERPDPSTRWNVVVASRS